MNMHLTNSDTIPVREFTSADELLKHVRSRPNMWGKPKKQGVAVSAQPRPVVQSEEVKEEEPTIDLHKLVDSIKDGYKPDGCRVVFQIEHEYTRYWKSWPIRRIIQKMCEGTGFTHDDVVGMTRQKQLVVLRYRCIMEVKNLKPELSLPQIARAFNRDHTTIIHALRKMGYYDDKKVAAWAQRPHNRS